VGLKLEDLAAELLAVAFFNWRFAAERVPVSIDMSDVAFSLAARRQLLIANVVYPREYAFGTIC
jgi:hypothetical protein